MLDFNCKIFTYLFTYNTFVTDNIITWLHQQIV